QQRSDLEALEQHADRGQPASRVGTRVELRRAGRTRLRLAHLLAPEVNRSRMSRNDNSPCGGGRRTGGCRVESGRLAEAPPALVESVFGGGVMKTRADAGGMPSKLLSESARSRYVVAGASARPSLMIAYV